MKARSQRFREEQLARTTRPPELCYPMLLAAFAIIAFSTSAVEPSLSDSAGTSFFEQKIRPVLADHCYKCHSTKATKLKGGLALDSRSEERRVGKEGRS